MIDDGGSAPGARRRNAASALPGEGPPPRPKRFYARAHVEARDGGVALLLDGRPARTPARHGLSLPTLRAAEAVAAEWNAQGETIEPAAMPVTRLVNTAIDGVAAQMAAVLAEATGYFASDLLIYRAGDPPPLVRAQGDAWDPVLDGYRAAFGVRFNLAEGVMFVAQPAGTLAVLARAAGDAVGAGAAAPFRLAALHVMTTLTGSALLALAVMDGRLGAAAAWDAAHVDETFQESRWGTDAEALARRDARRRDMMAAALLLDLVG